MANEIGSEREIHETIAQTFSFRNGPVLVVLTGMFALIFAWVVGTLGIPLGGILLFCVSALASATLYFLSIQITRTLIYAASEILLAPYGMSDRRAAYRFLYDYLFMMRLPILKITNGEIDQLSLDSPMAKWGFRGPGWLVIDGASAVLVEKELVESESPHKYSDYRVLTAGSTQLEKTDRIRGFVDLRLKQLKSQLKNVFTKDNIPLELTVAVEYRVKQRIDPLLMRSSYTPDEQAVRRAILVASDWKQQTETTIYGKIRDLIAEYDLNDIHGTYPEQVTSGSPDQDQHLESPRVPLQRALTRALNEIVEQWGAEVVKVTIDEIVMPDQVKETLRKAWAAFWKNKIEIEEANMEVKVAEIKREATLINAQTSAEAHGIRATASAEAQLAITRRADAIQQLTGNAINKELLGDMVRDAMISVTEANMEAARRSSYKDKVVEEKSAEAKNVSSD